MSEISSRERRVCEACGGELQWFPSEACLRCAHCGERESVASSETIIQEHNLSAGLEKALGGARGWSVDRISVRCESCRAVSVFAPERVAQRCSFCGSSSIVPYEELEELFRPESVLPLRWNEAAVRDALKGWFRRLWFAPSGIAERALADTFSAIYLPYWTFDARVSASWTAEAGYYYYETKTSRDANGRTVREQVRRIRWESASGQLEHFFDDDLVPASVGVRSDLLRAIEPFPTAELVPYLPDFVSGCLVERYQIDLANALETSKAQMDEELRTLCSRQIPGDTYRGLRISADYSARTFKHILAPVWLVSYRHGTRNFQVVVNGMTGKISGDRPYSAAKIALAILLGIAAIGIIALLGSLDEQQHRSARGSRHAVAPAWFASS
jgi:hypothetical protein